MKYSIPIKFIALILCAASLLGMAFCGASLFALAESGVYPKGYEAATQEYFQNRAVPFAQWVSQAYASEALGGATETQVRQYYHVYSWFDESRLNYAIRDKDGKTLHEWQSIDSDEVAYTFTIPTNVRYLNVTDLMTTDEYWAINAEPSSPTSNAQVVTSPMQSGISVGKLLLDYLDGTQRLYTFDSRPGFLFVQDGQTLIFKTTALNAEQLGDYWYINHVLITDTKSNVVYEAFGQGNYDTVTGYSVAGNVLEMYLPAGEAPAFPEETEAPAMETTVMDAIPSQGSTVAQIDMTYANARGEEQGTDSVSAVLLGTIFHDDDGIVQFQSLNPMNFECPQGSILTRISFLDASEAVLYEASNPMGVGALSNDDRGYLIFRAAGDTEPALTDMGTDTLAPTGQAAMKTAPTETAPTETTVTVPMETLIPAVAETAPAEAASEEAMPEEAMPEEAAADLPAEEAEAAGLDQDSAPLESAMVRSEPQYLLYYDSQTDPNMVAEYTLNTAPEYTVEISFAADAAESSWVWGLLRIIDGIRRFLVPVLGACAVVCAVSTVYLCCAAGRKKGTQEVCAAGLNRLPLDLYFLCAGSIVAGMVALTAAGLQHMTGETMAMGIHAILVLGFIACLVIVGFCYAFVAQAKTPGGFWYRRTCCGWILRQMQTLLNRSVGALLWLLRWLRNSFFPFAVTLLKALWARGKAVSLWAVTQVKRCFRRFLGLLSRLFSMLPVTWQFLSAGFILVFLMYVMLRTYRIGYILLAFCIFFGVILYAASAFAILLESARRMRGGDLDSKVDDRMLIGGFKDFANELNGLADVAVIAAQKQLKSERMKTELITNVSHDIKTPLTSIINYVDLLEKPHNEQQQAQYLEVLSRQSQRLKKLIEDLMEMSKASTGNIPVDITRMDAAEAVNQALGEFFDKLERAQLTPVFRQPPEPVEMMADGRLVWRVMSNLLGNAVKYALPGTRIYLDLLEVEGKVFISIKNISREELNVNADELVERFVRGDASRNTEGSGLGLNIAKSLMELQKGQLQILVDGDLFKTTLIFPGVSNRS